MATAKLRSSESYFIQVDTKFATEHGLNEAILAGKMLRLQETLRGATDDNGNKWVRLTLEEWVKEVPFMGEMTIRRTIESLEEKGIFLSTTFTGRSKWYRINPDYIEVDNKTSVQNEQIDYGNCAKRTDVSVQNEQLPRVLPIYESRERVESSNSAQPSVNGSSKKLPPVIPAFKIYVEVTEYYSVSKHWCFEMGKVVGDKPDDLDFWRRVVIGWTGKYATKHNVQGMLDYYKRHEIPGEQLQPLPKPPERQEKFVVTDLRTGKKSTLERDSL